MIKILNTTDSLAILNDRLDNSKRVFFTRFGDNDIMMMSGKDFAGNRLSTSKAYGGNKTIWVPELEKELREAFLIKDKNYLRGVSYTWDNEPGMAKGLFAPFPYKEKLENKISQFTNEKQFLIPVLFHYLICFRPDIFNEFVDKYIRGKKILFIGSTNKSDVEKIIGKVNYYVKVPIKTAYFKINYWWSDVLKCIRENEIDVVIPTAGQSSRVIVKRLYKLNKDYHCIDMGSLFDSFVSPTRTWLKLEGHNIRKRYDNAG